MSNSTFPHLSMAFVKAMDEIGQHGFEKHGANSFHAQVEKKRVIDRHQTAAIMTHSRQHTLDYEAGTPHDHFQTLLHQLAAVAFNAMVEAQFAGIVNEAPEAAPGYDLTAHLARHINWSRQTFGPDYRPHRLIDHVTKELQEIAQDPRDLEEWIDVITLGIDGAWRSGHTPEQITEALAAKLAKNEQREWPDWKTADPNKAIEHIERVGDHVICPIHGPKFGFCEECILPSSGDILQETVSD